MRILGVDNEVCTSCGACVEECPADLFGLEPDPDRRALVVVHRDPHRWCTGCGHCLAVCPRSAIRFESIEQPLEPAGIRKPSELCGYQAILPFLQGKRSVRHYRSGEVTDDVIRSVLEAMRWAPSGHNMQANRYLVITDREVLAAITDHTLASFAGFRRIVRLRKLLRPFLPVRLYEVLDSPGLIQGIDSMIERRRGGDDPILFSAPVAIVAYYPDMGPLSLLDPTIAFTYGMLAAQSLGLGSCWIGFAIQGLFRNRRMGRVLGIPAGMIVAGVMTLGYPVREYLRVPPRNRIAVRWLTGRPIPREPAPDRTVAEAPPSQGVRARG